MTKTVINKKKNIFDNKEVRSLDKFIRTHGTVRSGLTTDSNGGALVPSSLTNATEDLSGKFMLKKYTNYIPVSTNKGDMPVLDPDTVATTKSELDEFPDVQSDIKTVPFKINTFAGRLSISNEMLEDTEFPIIALLKKQMNTVQTNTENAEIAKVMNQVSSTTVTSLDQVLEAISTIDPRFASNIFIDQATLGKLRTMKDNNGRYLLADGQNSIMGLPIVVLPNYLNVKGIFIGSLKDAVGFFDKGENSLQYQRPSVYGTALCDVLRFDTRLIYPGALKHLVLSDGATK